ncbi:MAG: hypothetical protein LCH56_10880 [Proteobacteria bacterium]|nr:hypothetical protein [Pseudomonadota bacterium]
MKALALSLLLSSVLITHPTGSAQGAEPGIKEHPGDVALSQDAGGAWQYRSFPQLARLYISEKDRRGTSTCNEKCASAWPPLFSTENKDPGQRVGQWTVIQRADGKQQWAYKGQPVYQRYHDMPFDPSAKDVEGFKPLQP